MSQIPNKGQFPPQKSNPIPIPKRNTLPARCPVCAGINFNGSHDVCQNCRNRIVPLGKNIAGPVAR